MLKIPSSQVAMLDNKVRRRRKAKDATKKDGHSHAKGNKKYVTSATDDDDDSNCESVIEDEDNGSLEHRSNRKK